MNEDDLCNFLVNWIPFPRLRKRIYILLGMDIHPTAHIMRNCQFMSLRNLHIGERTIVGHHCFLDAKGGIFIGDDVNISSYAKIMTAKHVVDDPDFKGLNERITIHNRVWVASAALVLQGVELGEGAVVAAGSVVTSSVAPFTIVGGVPAKKIRERNRELRYRLHSRPSRFL
ncbi:MAG: acyltransferase [Thermodesulfobacteriota bacterium]|nr:acyltransferase [Thermodesulfobacteriota bacterium]